MCYTSITEDRLPDMVCAVVIDPKHMKLVWVVEADVGDADLCDGHERGKV